MGAEPPSVVDAVDPGVADEHALINTKRTENTTAASTFTLLINAVA